MLEHFTDLLRPDGFFLRREALAAGLSDRDLTSAVRSRTLVRIRHGAYAATDHVVGLDDRAEHVLRARAVVRAARSPVVLSHLTSLLVMGAPLWDLPLDRVHLTTPAERCGRREAGVVTHGGTLDPRDVVQLDGLPVTAPARAALELATLTDVERALVPMNHLLHQGSVTHEQLREQSRAMRHHPGSLGSDLVVALAQDRCESVGETRAFFLCWHEGLPRPEVNHVVRDAYGGFVARVDLAWPDLGVFLEFDGRIKYVRHLRDGEDAGDAVVREKRREERIRTATGWRCIRLTWADLQRPTETAAWIRSVLAGAPVYDNPLCPRR